MKPCPLCGQPMTSEVGTVEVPRFNRFLQIVRVATMARFWSCWTCEHCEVA